MSKPTKTVTTCTHPINMIKYVSYGEKICTKCLKTIEWNNR